jgi:adenylate cyclase class 2
VKEGSLERNVEIKARCADLAAARRAALASGARLLGRERQHDTYFRAQEGRLKLRRRWLLPAGGPSAGAGAPREEPGQLIWYRRADRAAARPSDYRLASLDGPEALLETLRGALEVIAEVAKEREVYWHEGVRIHLDRVEGRGTFLELEAVVGGGCDDRQAAEKLERLSRALGIAAGDLLACSYSDLP